VIYLQDPDVTILQGDALELLQGLPSGSVHMACTSPPFYGLRDYGTGSWEGGDPDCDHTWNYPPGREGRETPGGRGGSFPESRQTYGQTCGKCGATRIDQQIGLEATPDEWVERLVGVFRELRRVLRDDGQLWIEVGDSFASSSTYNTTNTLHTENGWKQDGERRPNVRPPAGVKPKDLIGAPWLLAFALRADGWYLRSEIIWAKPNPMPESCRDRPTVSHSRVFLLTKSARYFYDAEAIREPHHIGNGGRQRAQLRGNASPRIAAAPGSKQTGSTFDTHEYNPAGRNRRSVWTIPTEPYPEAHFATWPTRLVEPMVLAGTSERGVCPECGAPWERITEQEKENVKPVTIGPKVQGYLDRDDRQRPFPQGRTGESFRWKVTTTGWRPTCKHQVLGPHGSNGEEGYAPPPPVPATILDPFGGAGTTAVVARKLGRRAILLELNADYCALAARRLQQQSLFANA
jgi:DNA modification methylase